MEHDYACKYFIFYHRFLWGTLSKAIRKHYGLHLTVPFFFFWSLWCERSGWIINNNHSSFDGFMDLVLFNLPFTGVNAHTLLKNIVVLQ